MSKLNLLEDSKSFRKILLGVEGSGKSRNIILESSTFKSDDTILIGSHTINNNKEKYNYFLSLKNSLRNGYYIESDFELFRNMIEAQNEEFSKILINNEILFNEYLNTKLFSFNKTNSVFHELHANNSFKSNLYKCLKYDDSCSGFNSIIIQYIYNSLFKIKGILNYYIFYKLDSKIDFPKIDLTEIVLKNQFNSEAINFELSKYNIGYVPISKEALANWRGFRINRDKKLDKCLSEPSIIFAQNKVIDKTIIDKIEKFNIKDKVIYISDEITDCDFILNEQKNIESLGSISNKIEEKSNHLSVQDTYKLEQLSLTIDQLPSKVDPVKSFGTNMSVFIPGSKKLFLFNNKPDFSKRIKYFIKSIILTTEKLPSTILENALNFKIIEEDKDLSFNDKNLYFYPTGKKDEYSMIKKNENNIKNLIEHYKNISSKYNNIAIVGTKSFNTDQSIASCKGKNFINLEKLGVFINPNNPHRIAKYLAYVYTYCKQNFNTDNMYKYVVSQLRTDELNQTLARVCGYRRNINPSTIVDVFYFEDDNSVSLESLRYKGTKKSFSESRKYIDLLLYESNNLNTEFNKLEAWLDLKPDVNSDSTSNNNTIKLTNIIKTLKISKREFLFNTIPNLLKKIKSNVNDNVLSFFNNKLDKRTVEDFKILKTNKREINSIIKRHNSRVIEDIDLIPTLNSLLDNFNISNIKNDDILNFLKSNMLYYLLEDSDLQNIFNRNKSFLLSYMYTIEAMNKMKLNMTFGNKQKEKTKIVSINIESFPSIKFHKENPHYSKVLTLLNIANLYLDRNRLILFLKNLDVSDIDIRNILNYGNGIDPYLFDRIYKTNLFKIQEDKLNSIIHNINYEKQEVNVFYNINIKVEFNYSLISKKKEFVSLFNGNILNLNPISVYKSILEERSNLLDLIITKRDRYTSYCNSINQYKDNLYSEIQDVGFDPKKYRYDNINIYGKKINDYIINFVSRFCQIPIGNSVYGHNSFESRKNVIDKLKT